MDKIVTIIYFNTGHQHRKKVRKSKSGEMGRSLLHINRKKLMFFMTSLQIKQVGTYIPTVHRGKIRKSIRL